LSGWIAASANGHSESGTGPPRPHISLRRGFTSRAKAEASAGETDGAQAETITPAKVIQSVLSRLNRMTPNG